MDNKPWALAIGIALLFAVVVVVVGSAQDNYPDGVIVWQIPSGQWCQIVDGEFDKCYCPCEEEGRDVCEPTPIPTDKPKSTETPNPTDETPEPTEADKESCNRGLGNGSEDCDPGQSGGNPGAAGEDNE